VLCEFPLGERADGARAVEEDGARAGGALIEREDEFHVRRFSRERDAMVRLRNMASRRGRYKRRGRVAIASGFSL
jgi:hypothetical protein